MILVVGLDLHLAASGNPFHPYIGLVIDPADYIPFLGSDVHINGLKRGVSDTSGVLLTFQHIPLFGPFVMMPVIGHESMNFYSSEHTFADETRLCPKGHMLMTCNDVGIPLSAAFSPKKKLKFTPSLFAPTSYSLPIPTGAPVVLGGPYIPDWGGVLKGLATSMCFSTLLSFAPALFKALKKGAKKALTSFNHKVLKSNLGSKIPKTKSLGDWLCKHGFEPVNLVNGVVVYEGIDFSFPSLLPLSWERVYYSDSDYIGPLGRGVHCNYDRSVIILPEDEIIVLRLGDGRIATFPMLAVGESFFDRTERITLSRNELGYSSYEHRERLRYDFTYQDIYKGYDCYRLASLSNDDGQCIRLDYTESRLRTMVDAVGRKFVFQNSAHDLIESIYLFYPNGDSECLVRYSYDADSNMIGITDALGQTTHIRYEEHRMVEKTDRNGDTFYWEYDAQGRCRHTWGKDGSQEGWINYFPAEGYNIVRDANGAETRYNYDSNQLVRSIIDPLGNTTRYDYTESMELYREIDPEGRIWGWHYDDRGNQIGVSYPDGSYAYQIFDEQDRLVISIDPSGAKRLFIYDKSEQYAHRVNRILDADGSLTILHYGGQGELIGINKGDRSIALTYDEMGNLISYKVGEQEQQSWSYDYRGRMLSEARPLHPADSFEYDLLDRVRRIYRSDGNVIDLKYDAYDNITEVKDKERHVKMRYTSMGSLKEREERGERVHFVYDPMEQLTALTNEKGHLYRFQRNKAGQIIKEIGFDDIERQFVYNQAGEVTQVVRPNKQQTTYERDAFGRISRADYSDGSWEAFSYDKRGQLSGAYNAHSKITFERDTLGRIRTEQQFPAEGTPEDGIKVESNYNLFGERTQVRSSLGAEQRFDYNSTGLVEQLQADKEDGSLWESRICYDQAGREIERFATGDLFIKTQYDAYGSMSGRFVYKGKEQRGHRLFSWGINNKLISLKSHLLADPILFDYDKVGNLNYSSCGVYERLFKAPDIIGNIYRDKERKDRVYDRGGRLLKDKEYYYRYDGEGNLILKSPRNILEPPVRPEPKDWLDKLFTRTKPSPEELQKHYSWQEGDTAYEWYGNGMLKSVRTAEGHCIRFEYDALGRRTLKETQDTCYRYAWDGNVLLHEWSYSRQDKPRVLTDELGRTSYDREELHTNLVTWVYDGSSYTPVAKLTEKDSYTIVQDYLGTPIQALDSKGEVVWDCLLDIYGRTRSEVGEAGFIPFLYQGQYLDTETGLAYNRYRYYDPSTGNYISQDPIGLAGGNPTLYGDVFDSNTEIDPFGLDCGKATSKARKYEQQIQDMYGGKLPQSQREYRAMIGGKQVNGIADHVVDINGKNVAIEAKYVKDWSKSIRNPNSKIGINRSLLQNNKKCFHKLKNTRMLLTRLFIIQIAKIWQHITQKSSKMQD
ncbi:DUF6531 domain-containing protein [Porphyromonas circumdentaria]|nr:DUF6531 domain-containing protein [Porphyromonas circumdentaria]MBB6275014.1 RHS repeat-associated protein [Porphyromonas circumdentaria]